MSEKKYGVRLKGVKQGKYEPRQGNSNHSVKYNNITMLEQTDMAKEGFKNRLTDLRIMKGISARDMSLSMGMGSNYINSIENGETMPSMPMFFEICEFLKVTPHDFFSYTESHTTKYHELMAVVGWLDEESIELLITIARLIRNNGGLE